MSRPKGSKNRKSKDNTPKTLRNASKTPPEHSKRESRDNETFESFFECKISRFLSSKEFTSIPRERGDIVLMDNDGIFYKIASDSRFYQELKSKMSK